MDRHECRTRLGFIHKALRTALSDDAIYVDPAQIQHLVEDFNDMRDDLRKHVAGLKFLPTRTPLPHTKSTDFDDRGYFRASDVQHILQDVVQCLDALDSERDETKLVVAREGIFFAGQQFDAFVAAKALLEQAKKTIVVIDAYFDDNALALLSAKKTEVTASVLMKASQVTKVFTGTATAFNAQHHGLSVRTCDVFHDRFVIVDDTEHFHFGASLNHLGKRGFMFSKIEEPTVVEALTDQFKAKWARATVVI